MEDSITPDIHDDHTDISLLYDRELRDTSVATQSSGSRLRSRTTHPTPTGQLIPFWSRALHSSLHRRTRAVLTEAMTHPDHDHTRTHHCARSCDRWSTLSLRYHRWMDTRWYLSLYSESRDRQMTLS